MFPATDENTPFKNFESATAHAKICVLVQVISIIIAFIFWYLVAGLSLLAYIYAQPKLPPLAVFSLLGVSPFALAPLSYKIPEKIICIYAEYYVRKYVQVS